MDMSPDASSTLGRRGLEERDPQTEEEGTMEQLGYFERR